MFVGHPHPQRSHYLEVISAICPMHNLVIFPSMPLTEVHRHLLHERK